MPRLKLKSIAVGVLADKLAAVLSIGTLMALLAESSGLFQIAALVVGSLCTTLGAYVGARHAKRDYRAHGVSIGGVGLALNVLRFALTPATHSLAWELAAWSSVVVAGFLGGHIAARAAAQATVPREA